MYYFYPILCLPYVQFLVLLMAHIVLSYSFSITHCTVGKEVLETMSRDDLLALSQTIQELLDSNIIPAVENNQELSTVPVVPTDPPTGVKRYIGAQFTLEGRYIQKHDGQWVFRVDRAVGQGSFNALRSHVPYGVFSAMSSRLDGLFPQVGHNFEGATVDVILKALPQAQPAPIVETHTEPLSPNAASRVTTNGHLYRSIWGDENRLISRK